jgi:hypothetical protein
VRFELHLSTNGAAFGTEDMDESMAQAEVARILRAAADDIEKADAGGYTGPVIFGGSALNTPVRLRDINGNRVGYWLYTDEDLV